MCLFLTFLLYPVEAQSIEDDSDNDGMPDDWELKYGFDPDNSTDADQDPDEDNLTNLQEFENGTEPKNPDTDGGGVDDGLEIKQGYNPKDSSDDRFIDTDKDGIPDIIDPHPGTPDKKSEDKEKGDMVAGTSYFFCFIIFVVPGIVILLVIIFFYTKMRRDRLLEHDTRNRIYEYINLHPGSHYRAVMNDLGLHMGTTTHHLNMLEQQRYIKSYQDGMYRRFYPFDAKIKNGLILTDIQKRILQTIQGVPGISQTGIAQKIGQTRKIVHYHIKLLADAGFVQVESIGRETNCYYVGGLELDASSGRALTRKAA